MKISVIVGTRPNFIKVTQFRRAASMFAGMELEIIHTGQHYDDKMARVFFDQFGLHPDHFLDVPPGSPNSQMAEIMLRLERKFTEQRPDVVMVAGDVNSTLAAALTANKMGISLAHVESGLRSNDRNMPEEYNRLLTDELSDYLFVTEDSGMIHLKAEGKKGKIFLVGNTMIDTLVAYCDEIDKSDILDVMQLNGTKYILMTMHRPSNVDTKEGLSLLLQVVKRLTPDYKIVFPAHPRTLKFMEQFGMLTEFTDNKQLIFSAPLDYFSFQKLVSSSAFVLTDSGGIQEETTFLQVPCLTLRPNTERPVTVDVGSNTLLPFDPDKILQYVSDIQSGKYKKGSIPPLWDGKASERIFRIIQESI